MCEAVFSGPRLFVTARVVAYADVKHQFRHPLYTHYTPTIHVAGGAVIGAVVESKLMHVYILSLLI